MTHFTGTEWYHPKILKNRYLLLLNSEGLIDLITIEHRTMEGIPLNQLAHIQGCIQYRFSHLNRLSS